MGLEPSLKRAVKRIADALHEYAGARGWRYAPHAEWKSGKEYYIDIVVNVEWFRIYTTFAASEFEGWDFYERFRSVHEFLRAKLVDEPDLLRAIVLVTKNPLEFDTGGDVPLGRFDEQVDEALIEASARV